MYRHIIDRSNLDEVVAIRPATATEPLKKFTRLEELAKYNGHRTDIVLFNDTRSGASYSLHVTKDGYSGDLFLLDMLTQEEYDEVSNIALRMRANAIEYVFAEKLLVK